MGIKPESDPNVAVVVQSAVGTFTGTKKCVSLRELYIGCTTTNVMATANIPFTCVMTIEALNPGSDIPFATQQTTFVPKVEGTLDPFSKVGVYSKMTKVAVTVPAAYKYRVRANLSNSLGILLRFIPEEIRPAAAIILRAVGEFSTALLIDDISYEVSDTGCIAP